MNSLKPFRVDTDIAAPLDTVWEALTRPELIRQWFGWDHPALDDEITEIFVDRAQQRPGHRLDLAADQEISLRAHEGRTTITVVLPGPLHDAEWAEVYDAIEEGWRSFFDQLRFYLERRPTGKRRTLYLTGSAAGADLVAVLRGEDWHDSTYQRMAVDGEVLLGVGAQRPLADADAGPASLTVTTYDLTEAAFEALSREWTKRWAAITTG